MKSMSFNELVASISESTEIDESTIKTVLRDLGDLVAYEVSEGNPVSVPGVASIAPVYRMAKPKRMVSFGGVERQAAAKPASVAVKARPMPSVKNALPSARSAVGKRLGAEAAKKQALREKQARKRERAGRGVGVRVFG